MEDKTLAGKSFTWQTEVDVVRLLLKDESFTATFAEHLHPSLFREQLRPAVESALKYWQQYRKIIPADTLAQEILFKVSVGFTEAKQQALFKTLEDIAQAPQAPEYTADAIKNFIKFQKIENALVEGLDILDESEKQKDPERLEDVISLVERASSPIEITRPSFFFGDIDKRTEYRQKIATGEIQYEGFSSGIPELDKLCPQYDGLGKGQVGIWVGTTGRGKSIALAHAAQTSTFRNFNVLYVSLELPEHMLMDRADAMATQTEISDLIDSRNHIQQMITELKEQSNVGELVFIDMAFHTVTVNTVRNELKRLEQTFGFKPSVICIDYMDLMQPSRRIKEGGWKEQMVITQELHVLAGETKTAIWTASQGNRGAANKNDEGDLLGDSDVAESYGKLFAADLVVTINRTKAQLEMPEPKPAWLNVVKNRTGIANRRVGILTEFGKMQFYVGPYDAPLHDDENKSLDSKAYKLKKKAS